MNLILWRHAEALESEEGGNDRDRPLTSRGEKQTAIALGRKYKICPELSPGCSATQLLELVQWPNARNTVLVIGHQPTLGQTIAQLMGLTESECAVKKGAVWWLRNRERESDSQTVVVTVQSPEVL